MATFPNLQGSAGLVNTGFTDISVLSNGLVMFGVSEFWQNVIKGLVILAAADECPIN